MVILWQYLLVAFEKRSSFVPFFYVLANKVTMRLRFSRFEVAVLFFQEALRTN